MSPYSRHFLVSVFLSLTFFSGQYASAAGSHATKTAAYKTELLQEINTAAADASQKLKEASSYGCYWKVPSVLSTTYIKNRSLCLQMKKDGESYTDSQYKAALHNVQWVIDDAKRMASSEINKSTEDSPKLRKYVDHYLDILRKETQVSKDYKTVPQKLADIHQNVAKLRQDYEALYKTPVCPK